MKRRIEAATDFLVGTIGEPGEREFYLQLRNGNEFLSFATEKSQVIALVDRFNLMLKDLKTRGIVFEASELPQLNLPLISEFVVVEMAISWNLELKRVLLDLYDQDRVNHVEAFLTPNNVSSFCNLANRVVASGRPICPFCALPINRDGHLCPRANGYRR